MFYITHEQIQKTCILSWSICLDFPHKSNERPNKVHPAMNPNKPLCHYLWVRFTEYRIDPKFFFVSLLHYTFYPEFWVEKCTPYRYCGYESLGRNWKWGDCWLISNYHQLDKDTSSKLEIYDVFTTFVEESHCKEGISGWIYNLAKFAKAYTGYPVLICCMPNSIHSLSPGFSRTTFRWQRITVQCRDAVMASCVVERTRSLGPFSGVADDL